MSALLVDLTQVFTGLTEVVLGISFSDVLARKLANILAFTLVSIHRARGNVSTSLLQIAFVRITEMRAEQQQSATTRMERRRKDNPAKGEKQNIKSTTFTACAGPSIRLESGAHRSAGSSPQGLAPRAAVETGATNKGVPVKHPRSNRNRQT